MPLHCARRLCMSGHRCGEGCLWLRDNAEKHVERARLTLCLRPSQAFPQRADIEQAAGMPEVVYGGLSFWS